VAERFLIRTGDGPRPGTRVAEGWRWPLPYLLMTEGGQYVKASESSLPPQPEDGHLLRGAQYRWQSGNATAEQLTEAISTAICGRRLEEAVALLEVLATGDPGLARDAHDLLLAVCGD
jgi:hypothetical protein